MPVLRLRGGAGDEDKDDDEEEDEGKECLYLSQLA